MRFVDTNILLYSISSSPKESAKAATALAILEEGDLSLSVQVLQEFYVQSTRPTKRNRITHEQAGLLIESFLRFPVQETTVALLQAAVTTSHRFQISYWDAAIIEAARLLGCRTVLSEDLNHGQSYGGVQVVNPFQTN
ncbi:MAG: PIN domain-containing protein [bacterium]|nr:PIN domain-containing protein [bacterium]